LSVFSREDYRHHAKSLPEKYNFFEEISTWALYQRS
jgi:hypothetical protein